MKSFNFYEAMAKLGFTFAEANTLRLAERALQRWGERECGDGSNWAIERDEETGKPFNVYHGTGDSRKYPIADREAGAIRRIDAIIKTKAELTWYHQTDCRGCQVYILRKSDLADGAAVESCYTRGFACCV